MVVAGGLAFVAIAWGLYRLLNWLVPIRED